MADPTLPFELVSPTSLLAEGEARIVTLPGAEGDMGVMSNHAPVMTGLRTGIVEIELSSKKSESFFVRGGFADIGAERLTILAEFAVPESEMTKEMKDEMSDV